MNSPFIIIPDFLSPLKCEQILADIEVKQADTDINGDPIKMERTNIHWNEEFRARFQEVIPMLEEKYNCTYRGLEAPVFQHYPENAKVPASQPGCENSKYVRKRWIKTRDVDLVGLVWLKDFNDSVPVDLRHEVFGGKLEFPAHGFSLVPQRGTFVMFPAGPHFITVTSPVLLGSLDVVKLCVSIRQKDNSLWFYQPQNHPGKWQDWLNEHL